MVCKKCKNQIPDGSEFCGYCGYRAAKKKEEKGKSKTPFLIGLAIGLLVALILTVVLVITRPVVSYDEQIEKGYDLLEEGKHEEAVDVFDEAIKTDEKRPEGYMGKAQAMAHDPNMTMEKAKAIADVLEEGYIKTGSEKIILHVEVVQDIMEGSGFIDEAKVLDSVKMLDSDVPNKNELDIDNFERSEFDMADNPEKTLKKSLPGQTVRTYQHIGDLFIFQNEDNSIYLRNKDEEELLVNGDVNYGFLTSQEFLYFVRNESSTLYEMNISTREVREIVQIHDFNGFEDGGGDGYIFISKRDGSKEIVNIDTGEHNVFDFEYSGVYDIYVYDGKVYYACGNWGTEESSLVEADLDGSNKRVIYENGLEWYRIDNMIYYTQEQNKYDTMVKTYNMKTKVDKEIREVDSSWVIFSDFGCIYYSEDGYVVEQYDGKIYTYNEEASIRNSQGKNILNVEIDDNDYDPYTTIMVIFQENKKSKPITINGTFDYYYDGKAYYNYKDEATDSYRSGFVVVEFE